MRTPAAPPDAAVARFSQTIEERHWLPEGDQPFLVAVSGGADSLALLLLASAAYGRRCHAATVDHALRPESAHEAARVAEVCAALDVPHRTLSGALARRVDGTANLSSRARELRYRLLLAELREIGGSAVLTGHHADDQVETLVLRLNRSAGVAGLAGIRARNGQILRPLLDWSRAQLAQLVRDCGVEPIEDSSNSDDRFDRARLRKLLAGSHLFDPVAVARSMALLAEAEDALESIADAAFAELHVGEDEIEFDTREHPGEIVRRVIIRCVEALDPEARPRGATIDRLLRMRRDERASVGKLLVEFGLQMVAGATGHDQPYWPVYRFSPAPPRRPGRADGN